MVDQFNFVADMIYNKGRICDMKDYNKSCSKPLFMCLSMVRAKSSITNEIPEVEWAYMSMITFWAYMAARLKLSNEKRVRKFFPDLKSKYMNRLMKFYTESLKQDQYAGLVQEPGVSRLFLLYLVNIVFPLGGMYSAGTLWEVEYNTLTQLLESREATLMTLRDLMLYIYPAWSGLIRKIHDTGLRKGSRKTPEEYVATASKRIDNVNKSAMMNGVFTSIVTVEMD